MSDTSLGSSEDGLRTQGEGPEPRQRGSPAPTVLTFLIADVRGYTQFTQEHGDEEAGRLAAIFAELARETVLSSGGDLIELRGDEALCVFGSARQALRAAVELQVRFRRPTENGSAFLLPIGIGLDAGEAVPIEGGYRGGALNTAARLCSIAAPGQILATDTVVSLARRLEGIRFVDRRRPVRLKGLANPVRVIEVVPEAGLPPLPVVGSATRPRVTKQRLAVGAIAGVALGAALVAFALTRSDGASGLEGLDANAVGLIDAEPAAVESQVKVGSEPSAITTGGGYVWVASKANGTVSRFDPESRTAQTLSLGGGPGGVAYGDDSLWVTTNEERGVVQVNAKNLAVVQTIPVGNGPGAVAVGNGAVWVANRIDGTVSRIGLDSGSVTDTIPVGPSPAGIAVGAGAVWVTSEDTGTVVQVDPRSRTIVDTVNVGNGPTGIAVGGGAVWVANRQDGTVSRIDPATNSVSATIPVGSKPAAIAAGPDVVWVANSGDATIMRIDSKAGRVADTLTLGSSPSALTLADRKVWATTALPLAGHRGGVLRVESDPSNCRCVDPAFSLSTLSSTDNIVPSLVYDTLVAYRRVDGAAGATLLPNLVVRLPAPTDDGKTYSLQLRRGIRYSDGSPVRASDFRSSLERLLTIDPNNAVFIRGIVGVEKCAARTSKRCDLSRGIETDDGASRITIRLKESDPEFLYRLALPNASVIPARTLLRSERGHSVPGTGPYRVASLTGREIRLVRNQPFHVWSPDARPDGYPDEIRLHLSDDVEASLKAVENGKADWVSLLFRGVPPERLRGLLTRHADRLHSDPSPLTNWWFLNTKAPPFDDLRVRRALNFALDRKALTAILGGNARTTCQILPPSLPGYRPYCPYTRNPNAAGTWTAPDLAKAGALVAASGTKGMRVEVMGADFPPALRGARYMASLLRQLGYRATRRTVDLNRYNGYVADSRNRAQLGGTGWFADTLAASNFFQPIFTCASFVPKSPHNSNLFEFCDKGLDAKMQEAAALQLSNPVRANELWAEVDHALVDQAVALPWGNPRNQVLVSGRVGNYQSHPLIGTLLDQVWVK